jgi:hypothetical protein
VRVRPIDLGSVFPVSGGLPLGKRAPQRQAYRLVDLARFSRHLGLPLNPKPKFFPVAGDDAARLIIAVDITTAPRPRCACAPRCSQRCGCRSGTSATRTCSKRWSRMRPARQAL